MVAWVEAGGIVAVRRGASTGWSAPRAIDPRGVVPVQTVALPGSRSLLTWFTGRPRRVLRVSEFGPNGKSWSVTRIALASWRSQSASFVTPLGRSNAIWWVVATPTGTTLHGARWNAGRLDRLPDLPLATFR
ncbi:MAG: hypothetical protein HYX33_00975 [Actinobacteria bacterium]|nr:hypothetical protein [Actinomycetota bacterium]